MVYHVAVSGCLLRDNFKDDNYLRCFFTNEFNASIIFKAANLSDIFNYNKYFDEVLFHSLTKNNINGVQ